MLEACYAGNICSSLFICLCLLCILPSNRPLQGAAGVILSFVLLGAVQKTGQLYSDTHSAMSQPSGQEAAAAEAGGDQDTAGRPALHKP